MSTSRETARDALVALLTAALVGTGKPVKTVTGSKVTKLEGLTPLVSVLSGGSSRKIMTFEGNQAAFNYEVQVWVLQATTGWTNAQAEDALDTIESLIAATYESAVNTGNWAFVEYTTDTTVMEVSVGGVQYYLERIPTTVILSKN